MCFTHLHVSVCACVNVILEGNQWVVFLGGDITGDFYLRLAVLSAMTAL